jgi:hypothetical protein
LPLCRLLLWIVHFWLPLRYSLTFMYNTIRNKCTFPGMGAVWTVYGEGIPNCFLCPWSSSSITRRLTVPNRWTFCLFYTFLSTYMKAIQGKVLEYEIECSILYYYIYEQLAQIFIDYSYLILVLLYVL